MRTSPHAQPTDFVAEGVILIVGLLTSLFAEIFVDEIAVAAITAILTFLISASTWAIKRELSDRVSSISATQAALQRIQSPRWRADATQRIQRLEAELREWSDGRRSIPQPHSIPYQIGTLQRAQTSVDAIHVALTKDALALWDKETGRFNGLVDAFERLPTMLIKRRVVILDDADKSILNEQAGRKFLQDDMVIRVCKRQRAAPPEGLGFELFVLWRSELVAVEEDSVPQDLLLVDRTEALTVRIIGEEIYETTALVDPARVRDEELRFERYLSLATPIEHLLPPDDVPQPAASPAAAPRSVGGARRQRALKARGAPRE